MFRIGAFLRGSIFLHNLRPMTMNTETKKDDTTLNIYQRLNRVMKEVEYVKKDSEIQGIAVVSHDAVTSVVRPAMVKHGIIPRPMMGSCEVDVDAHRAQVTVEMELINMDNPSERYYIKVTSMAIDQRKPYDKCIEIAYSKAVKSCYLKALNLESGEEEESRSIVNMPIGKQHVKELRDKLKKTLLSETAFLNRVNVKQKTRYTSMETIEVKHLAYARASLEHWMGQAAKQQNASAAAEGAKRAQTKPTTKGQA